MRSITLYNTLTRIITYSIIGFFSFFCLFSVVFGEKESRGNYGSDPFLILDRVVKDANEDYKIQESQLDRVSELQGSFPREYKIANTLDSVRQRIPLYLQWATFVGLAVAVILLIINGLMMVTNAAHDEGKIEKIKGRIIYIMIGIVVLTGFYAIIRLFVALLTTIFGDGTGTTGF